MDTTTSDFFGLSAHWFWVKLCWTDFSENLRTPGSQIVNNLGGGKTSVFNMRRCGFCNSPGIADIGSVLVWVCVIEEMVRAHLHLIFFFSGYSLETENAARLSDFWKVDEAKWDWNLGCFFIYNFCFLFCFFTCAFCCSFRSRRNARQLFEEMLVLHLRAWRQKICCLLLHLGSMLNAEAISFAFFLFLVWQTLHWFSISLLQ